MLVFFLGEQKKNKLTLALYSSVNRFYYQNISVFEDVSLLTL